MAVRTLLVAVPIIRHCLRPLLTDRLQSLDCNVQISHGAKLGVEPLQFIRYSHPLGVIDHRREKHYGCAQARERDAHLMQRCGIAAACRLVISGQISKMAPRQNPKGSVARHRWIQSQGRVGPLALRRLVRRGGPAWWVRRWRHCCSALSDPGRLTTSDPGLAWHQKSAWASRSIDDRPIDRANMMFLLRSGNLRRGVGRLDLAGIDTVLPGRKLQHEKKADKPDT